MVGCTPRVFPTGKTHSTDVLKTIIVFVEHSTEAVGYDAVIAVVYGGIGGA